MSKSLVLMLLASTLLISIVSASSILPNPVYLGIFSSITNFFHGIANFFSHLFTGSTTTSTTSVSTTTPTIVPASATAPVTSTQQTTVPTISIIGGTSSSSTTIAQSSTISTISASTSSTSSGSTTSVTTTSSTTTTVLQNYNDYMYAFSQGSREVSVIHGTQIVGTVTLSGRINLPLGSTGTNGYAYVLALNSSSGSSFSLNIFKGGQLVSSMLSISSPVGMVYDTYNNDLYIASCSPNEVYVVSGTSLVSTVSLSGCPGGSMSFNNQHLYVPTFGSGIAVITGTQLATTISTSGTVTPIYSFGSYTYGLASYPNDTLYLISGTSLTNKIYGNFGALSYDQIQGTLYSTPVVPGGLISVFNGTALVPTHNSTGILQAGYNLGQNNQSGYTYFQLRNNITVFGGSNTPIANINIGGTNNNVPAPYLFSNPSNNYVYVPAASGTAVISGTSLAGSLPAVSSTVMMFGYDPVNNYVYIANSTKLYVASGASLVGSLTLPNVTSGEWTGLVHSD